MRKKYLARQILLAGSQLAVILFLCGMSLCGDTPQAQTVVPLGLILLLFADAAYLCYKNIQNNGTLAQFTDLLLLLGWQFLFSLFESRPFSRAMAGALVPLCCYRVACFLLHFVFQASAYRYQKGCLLLLKAACAAATVCCFVSQRAFSFAYLGQCLLSLLILLFIGIAHHQRVWFVLKSQRRALLLSGCFVLPPFLGYVTVFHSRANYLGNMGSYFIVLLVFVSIHNIVFQNQPQQGKLYLLAREAIVCLAVLASALLGLVMYAYRISLSLLPIFAHSILFLVVAHNALLCWQMDRQPQDRPALRDRQHFFSYSLAQIKREEDLKKDFSNYLHDDILQDILSAKNLARKAEQPQVKQLLLETLDALNTSIRQQMQSYHPLLLKSLTLKQNLQSMLDTLAEKYRVEVRLTCDDAVFLVEPYNVLLYRMMKELVNNALKHANPTQVCVVLAQEKGDIRLQVTDNGTGFPSPAPSHGAHQGLASLQEQVGLLGGAMVIQPGAEVGTQITITMPMKGADSYENFIGG